ncbi:MAG: hypothetical protein FWC39_10605 [Bacteroidetes bacterium]|nr:hypothetical protein [Bacteroidota bacterium]
MKSTTILLSLVSSIVILVGSADSSFLILFLLAALAFASYRLFVRNYYQVMRKLLKFNQFINTKLL